MENKLSTLNELEQLVKEHKKKSLDLFQTEISKNLISANCNSILQIINELKDSEKEQSRLDWKAGYIASCLDVQEFFDGSKKPHLEDYDLAIIEQQSLEYIKTKFK
jgi:hypothetical protein